MHLNLIALLLLFIITCFQLLQISQCANILFFFGVSTYSHRITVWNLVETLADKGHNVTFFQPYHPKRKHPKVTEFFPKEVEEALLEEDSVFRESLLNIRRNYGRIGNIWTACALPLEGKNICNKLLSRQVTLDWINNSKFDLVFIDGLFNDCGLGFAYKSKAKVIVFGTSSLFSWFHEPFGIPAETSWIPELHVSFQYPLNFIERVISTLVPLIQYYYRVWFYFPEIDYLFRTKLDPNMPPVQELEKNISLMFLNTHFSEEFARSFPPFIVPIGGVHLVKQEKKEVPKNMVKFMDESGKDGFILVSFGSAAYISEAPEDYRNIFYEAFKNSKTRFIWKWEGERPNEMPANVLTADWLPQAEILAHPNIKAFMTHGGLMSIQEAITHGVPLITFPIFAEQDYNSYRIERTGRGVKLELASLTLGQLQTAITQILKNPKFKNNMEQTKKLFEDRPMSPIETAVWWTDYVLRTPDTSHLKPLSMEQTWYERRLLDVWMFLAGIIFVIFATTIYIFKKILVFLFCSKSKKQPVPIYKSAQKLKTK